MLEWIALETSERLRSFEGWNLQIELLRAESRSVVFHILTREPKNRVHVAILAIFRRVQFEYSVLALKLAVD